MGHRMPKRRTGVRRDALVSPTPDVGQIAADAGVEPDAPLRELGRSHLTGGYDGTEPEDTWADDVDEMVDRLGRLPEPGTEPGTTIGAASAPSEMATFSALSKRSARRRSMPNTWPHRRTQMLYGRCTHSGSSAV